MTSVGDADFRAKSQRVFSDRMANSGAVVVSHFDADDPQHVRHGRGSGPRPSVRFRDEFDEAIARGRPVPAV